jgi:hypothetical protein
MVFVANVIHLDLGFTRPEYLLKTHLFYLSETVKLLPQNMVTYKVFGKPGGPHYAHYDLVGSRLVCLVLSWTLVVSV